MKPFQHAKNSAKKHGGKWEDYIKIHDFIDSSKAAMPDMRHRAALHSAFGIFLVEQVFGTVIENSEGKKVCTRDLAEDHVIEDLGFIPTLEHWFKNMTMQDWMFGGRRKPTEEKFIKID
jgi:hypothetical protein